MTHNRLGAETSPYLKQHQDNPVHWYPWGDEALVVARSENKPILLSIGYSACHWCHVMAHESFENADIADVMNAHFINVKVDREERPDIDQIYQTALSLMGQHGGWPLTMFLTPDGDPFWGGTYFPREPKFGRPGFEHILRSISGAYKNDPNGISKNVASLQQGLKAALSPSGSGQMTSDLLNTVAALAAGYVDRQHGGTEGAPKFPQPMFFRFLWHAYLRTGNDAYKDTVVLTLDNICQGGIYDHLGGGFARYSTDERWLAPHFEKMLYDNALLIELLSDVYLDTRNPLYAARVEETIEWLVREMAAEHDEAGHFAFASALDADSEGEEGKFYVWAKGEVETVLGEKADVFCQTYDVTDAGNWEGHSILNRLSSMRWRDEGEAEMTPLRQKLFNARAQRIRPGRDDKVLTDWTGMTVAALARAGITFDRPDWTQLAISVFDWSKAHLIAKDGRFRHSRCNGLLQHPAVLDDYAHMARSALFLFEVTADPKYLNQAENWVKDVALYYGDNSGGYLLAAKDTPDLVARPRPVMDNAVPSGNGIMAEVLARLHLITGTMDYGAQAKTLFDTFMADEAKRNIQHPTLLIAWEMLRSGAQIVVVGPIEHSDLSMVALKTPNRNSVVTRLSDTNNLPTDHPARGKQMIDGLPTAYVCAGQTCGLPITKPKELHTTLQQTSNNT